MLASALIRFLITHILAYDVPTDGIHASSRRKGVGRYSRRLSVVDVACSLYWFTQYGLEATDYKEQSIHRHFTHDFASLSIS